MVQFNLLPDVKIQYINARRTKRLVTLVSLGLSALSVFVLLLSLVTVDVVQKKSLHDLDRDITTNSSKLKAVPNIDKILTVQNQLNTLTSLHDMKPVSSRLFGYVSQLTPDGVTTSSLQIDFTKNTLTLTGAAPSLDLVNKFTDTLKETNYIPYTTDTAGQTQQASDLAYHTANNKFPDSTQNLIKPAFSAVVLSNFSKTDSGATYTIDLNFDPLIFANTNNVTLVVPSGVVSNTNVLFQKAGN